MEEKRNERIQADEGNKESGKAVMVGPEEAIGGGPNQGAVTCMDLSCNAIQCFTFALHFPSAGFTSLTALTAVGHGVPVTA